MFFNSHNKKRKHVVDNHGKLVSKKNNDPTKKYSQPKSKKWKKPLIITGLVLVAVCIWFGVSAFSALGKIITDNVDGGSHLLSFTGELNPDDLNEGDSRINILLFGIGGSGHPGGQLADSIEVLSISPKDKSIALLSIPRDLKVTIPGYGTGKINSAHSTGVANAEETGGGPELLKKTVSEILDLPIHYYVRIDFDGFIKFIDAIGGVDVDVPKAISDPYYPATDMKGYSPFYISAGEQHLDGTKALKYARSRETTSDFDRSARQQQIILAVKEKALSLGVLANPQKISNILKVLGDHLRTDIQLEEVQKLFDYVKDWDASNIITKVLDSSTDGPLMSTSNGGYYLVPRAGDFSEVQRIAHELFSDSYLQEENAKIEIYNATGQRGVAGDVSELLESYGYNIIDIDTYDTVLNNSKIIDYSGGEKPFTLEYLKNRFTATVDSNPQDQNSNADIVLIIGKNYEE